MKLKKLLNENLWNERKFGEPLPTLKDTTKAYKLKQENLNENDLNDVSKMLGKSSSDVNKFLKRHRLKAHDLLEVIYHFHFMGTGQMTKKGYEIIIASMKGNRKALRDLKDVLDFSK